MKRWNTHEAEVTIEDRMAEGYDDEGLERLLEAVKHADG